MPAEYSARAREYSPLRLRCRLVQSSRKNTIPAGLPWLRRQTGREQERSYQNEPTACCLSRFDGTDIVLCHILP